MALAARGAVTLHTVKYALGDFQSAIDDLDAGRVRGVPSSRPEKERRHGRPGLIGGRAVRRNLSDRTAEHPNSETAEHQYPTPGQGQPMIFITAKFRILPEHAERWPEISRSFTEATRAEPGNLWFDWSRSLDDPNEYVLVEAFADGAAGAAHVNSAHFKTAQQEFPQYLAETPRIVNAPVPGTNWSELGELAVGR